MTTFDFSLRSVHLFLTFHLPMFSYSFFHQEINKHLTHRIIFSAEHIYECFLKNKFIQNKI